MISNLRPVIKAVLLFDRVDGATDALEDMLLDLGCLGVLLPGVLLPGVGLSIFSFTTGAGSGAGGAGSVTGGAPFFEKIPLIPMVTEIGNCVSIRGGKRRTADN